MKFSFTTLNRDLTLDEAYAEASKLLRGDEKQRLWAHDILNEIEGFEAEEDDEDEDAPFSRDSYQDDSDEAFEAWRERQWEDAE